MSGRHGLIAFAFLAAITASAAAYDGSWYRVEYWGREYPEGFTTTEDVTIKIRPELDPDVAATVTCDLSKGATYHPWNDQRTDERKLQFVTFSKIEHYVVDKSHVWDAFRESDKAETKVAFKPGDRWEYLAYGAEGYFVVRFNGEIYSGFQDLVDVSTSLEKIPDFDSRVDEWLHLTCDNGVAGWLLMKDVEGLQGFGEPNTLGYGSAADKTD